MFPWRKRRRKLQKQYAHFSCISKNRSRTEKNFQQLLLRLTRRYDLPLRVCFDTFLEIRGQQFCRCRVKRKQLVQFDVERKTIRRCRTPALHHARLWHGIKRRVHLDQIKMLRIPTQSIARREFFWIPVLDKTGIRPTRGANKDLPVHVFNEVATIGQRKRHA